MSICIFPYNDTHKFTIYLGQENKYHNYLNKMESISSKSEEPIPVTSKKVDRNKE